MARSTLGRWACRRWRVARSTAPLGWSLVLAATVVLGAVRCAAATVCDSTDACLQVIAATQGATRSLSARFRQTKYVSLLAEPLVSTGRFAFKQPDQILWQLDEPRVTVRIDRQGVHLPDVPGVAEEAAALAPFSDVMRQLSGMFTGSLGTVQNHFTVQAHADEATIRVHLVPRDEQWQRMLRSLDVAFAIPDGVVKTMRLDEALGDHLEIEFSEIHRNDTVADAAIGDTS